MHVAGGESGTLDIRAIGIDPDVHQGVITGAIGGAQRIVGCAEVLLHQQRDRFSGHVLIQVEARASRVVGIGELHESVIVDFHAQTVLPPCGVEIGAQVGIGSSTESEGGHCVDDGAIGRGQHMAAAIQWRDLGLLCGRGSRSVRGEAEIADADFRGFAW